MSQSSDRIVIAFDASAKSQLNLETTLGSITRQYKGVFFLQ